MRVSVTQIAPAQLIQKQEAVPLPAEVIQVLLYPGQAGVPAAVFPEVPVLPILPVILLADLFPIVLVIRLRIAGITEKQKRQERLIQERLISKIKQFQI